MGTRIRTSFSLPTSKLDHSRNNLLPAKIKIRMAHPHHRVSSAIEETASVRTVLRSATLQQVEEGTFPASHLVYSSPPDVVRTGMTVGIRILSLIDRRLSKLRIGLL